MKDICGKKYGGDKDEEIGKFFSVCEISTDYFSVDYILILYKKTF